MYVQSTIMSQRCYASKVNYLLNPSSLSEFLRHGDDNMVHDNLVSDQKLQCSLLVKCFNSFFMMMMMMMSFYLSLIHIYAADEVARV